MIDRRWHTFVFVRENTTLIVGTSTQKTAEYNTTTPCQRKIQVTVTHRGGVARGGVLQRGGGVSAGAIGCRTQDPRTRGTVVENSRLFAQRGHSTWCAPNSGKRAIIGQDRRLKKVH